MSLLKWVDGAWDTNSRLTKPCPSHTMLGSHGLVVASLMSSAGYRQQCEHGRLLTSGANRRRESVPWTAVNVSCRVLLVGLVVKASASRAEDPGFESRLRRDFFGGPPRTP